MPKGSWYVRIVLKASISQTKPLTPQQSMCGEFTYEIQHMPKYLVCAAVLNFGSCMLTRTDCLPLFAMSEECGPKRECQYHRP